MARSDQKLILLAEDNEDDVLLFNRALKKAGLTNPVCSVTSAQAAMDYLLGRGIFADRLTCPFPSVFAIDFHLPGLNGFELLKWVRGVPSLQSLHCIVITGDHRPDLLRDCYAAGTDSFLVKPCKPEDLLKLSSGFSQQWLAAPHP
jgi:CheY-like chemotaxis protein